MIHACENITFPASVRSAVGKYITAFASGKHNDKRIKLILPPRTFVLKIFFPFKGYPRGAIAIAKAIFITTNVFFG